MDKSKAEMKYVLRAKRLIIGFLTLVGSLGNLTAQEVQITGVVKDGSGEGLPGVTVKIEGTTNGTVTDIDGSFSLDATANTVLEFSSVGFTTKSVEMGVNTYFDIQMEDDIAELSEVVVIGYGSTKKKDLTGVVNKISSKDFNQGQFASPKQLLAGKVPGLQIATDGNPRGGGEVRIRGGSSFSGNQNPLYVIDGIPISKDMGHDAGEQDPLSFINPSDIEDITVLKDASAAAIYGVQGAAGVIIITTKSGASGKLKLSYDGSFGVNVNQAGPDMLTKDEFTFAVGRKGPRNLGFLGSADTDWVDEITRTSTSQSHGISASFGKGDASVRVSLNYLDVNGVLITDRNQRISPSVKYVQTLFNNDLTVTLSYNGVSNRDRLAPNVMSSALSYAPTEPVNVDNPATANYFEWDNPLAPTNPVSTIEQTFNQNRATRNFISGRVEYKVPFLEGLSFKGNFGHDNLISRSQNISLPTLKPDDPTSAGGLWLQRAVIETRTYEVFITYKRDFGDDHSLDLIGGHSFQDFAGNYPSYSKDSDNIPYDNYGISDPLKFLDDSYVKDNKDILIKGLPSKNIYRLASLWSRINYSFKGRYLLTATVRYDGSSRFGRENNFNMFPSLAAAWRLIDEPFAEPLKSTFDELKLRVGLGTTGNQAISESFGYVDLYSLGDERARYIIGSDTVFTLRPSGADPGIQWEETKSFNVGVDFGFFEGRLNGSFDYYVKNTSDLLAEAVWPVGTLTSFTQVTNIGSFEVKGAELILNAHIYERGDLKWGVSVNGSTYVDEVTGVDFSNDPSFFGIRRTGIAGDVGQTIQVLKLGRRVNSFLVYEHIIEDNGLPISDGDDRNGDGLKSDLDMYVDQDGNGIINEDDLRPFRAPSPRLSMGFTSNLSYRKWDMSFTLRSQLKNYVYNNIASQYGAYEGVDDPFNAPRNIHSSAFTNDFTEKQLFSSIYVEDASFLKLDNITFGYRFETSNSLKGRAYLTVSNLLTITNYSGVDPEVGISGVDNNPYPRSRSFILGLNLNLN